MSLLYNTFSMVGVTPTPNVYKINPSLALICPFVYLFNTPLQLISTSPPTTHLHLPPLTPPQPISISHLPSAPSFTQFTSLAYLPAPYPCHAPPSPTHSPAPPFSITSSSTKPQCQLMYVLGPKIHTPLPPTRPSLPPRHPPYPTHSPAPPSITSSATPPPSSVVVTVVAADTAGTKRLHVHLALFVTRILPGTQREARFISTTTSKFLLGIPYSPVIRRLCLCLHRKEMGA